MSQDTCVIHSDTEPLETHSFLRRLFNAFISTAYVIIARKGGCGVYSNTVVGRDCVVGIASRCGLDGTRIESRWGAGCSAPVQTGPVPPYNGYRVSFPGIKWPGRSADHPPPMSAKVIGWTLPLSLLQYVKDRKGSGSDVIQRYPGANLVTWFLCYLTNLFQDQKLLSCQLRWNKIVNGECVNICKDTINTCFFFRTGLKSEEGNEGRLS
jgi:hypothetical protein